RRNRAQARPACRVESGQEVTTMLERRRSKRTKSYRGRVWVAAPTRCWADIRDASSGGMCIQLRTSVALGQTITVYRQLEARLGPGRVGTVVFVRGRSVGIRYSVDLASERRGALRHKTHGIRGWVSGPVETSAAIKNLSASGAAVAPMLPLRRGAK